MSEHYSNARPWLRTLRLVERGDASELVPSVRTLREFEEDISGHLDGSWLKSEVHACGVRLYVVYREVEDALGSSGSVDDFALVLGESSKRVFNWLRGSAGIRRYTLDLLHSWCTLLSRHWLSEGVVVHLLCHPSGVVEPLVTLSREVGPSDK